MKSNELIRILKKDGWFALRQKLSHIVMKHEIKANHIIVPAHGSHEVGTGLASKILRDAGLIK